MGCAKELLLQHARKQLFPFGLNLIFPKPMKTSLSESDMPHPVIVTAVILMSTKYQKIPDCR